MTERASENPMFVEDLIRDVALALRSIDAIGAITVESENFESIHNHSAYAQIQMDRKTVSLWNGPRLRACAALLFDVPRSFAP